MVFRIEKTSNYTVMSNYHLRDKNLSLKAKGLLSWMLSNNDEWDYSIAGMVSCCKEGETTVNTALRELQEFGYVEVVKCKPDKTNNRIHYEYNVYERPKKSQAPESQGLESQDIENPVQINTKQINTKNNKKVVSKDTTTEFQFGKTKPKKDNLYTKCVAMVNDYTTNEELQKVLIDYLRVRLEMKDKPIYLGMWKGLLNKLDREFDVTERLEVVRQSIERGYASFFPVNKNNYGIKSESGVRHVPRMTDEDYVEEEKRLAELESKGVRVRF